MSRSVLSGEGATAPNLACYATLSLAAEAGVTRCLRSSESLHFAIAAHRTESAAGFVQGTASPAKHQSGRLSSISCFAVCASGALHKRRGTEDAVDFPTRCPVSFGDPQSWERGIQASVDQIGQERLHHLGLIGAALADAQDVPFFARRIEAQGDQYDSIPEMDAVDHDHRQIDVDPARKSGSQPPSVQGHEGARHGASGNRGLRLTQRQFFKGRAIASRVHVACDRRNRRGVQKLGLCRPGKGRQRELSGFQGASAGRES